MIERRLLVWFVEMLCQAVLIPIVEMALAGFPRDSPWAFVVLVWSFSVFIMLGSGYLLTTVVFRLLVTTKQIWAYPVVAAFLFVIHLQFFNTGFDPLFKIGLQIGGAVVVFVCTMIGSWFLRKWQQAAIPN